MDLDFEGMLHDARPQVPAGLAARLAAAARDPQARARVFWADVERTARRAVVFAAAAAAITIAVAVSLVVATPTSDQRTTASLLDYTEQQSLDTYLESP